MTHQDTIIELPVDHLQPSPFNPRQTFVGIDELQANIVAEGRIHQPLLVRPIVPPLFDAGPATEAEAVAGYQVVFGHRRLKAARAAGWTTVPCMVRAMTDAEARSAQIAENLAREDVHPIEEAEGFAALMQDAGTTADELAARVGKSRSYVYARLKLLQAAPAVRRACLDGEIDAESALLVARVGPHAVQDKALARIKAIGANLGDGGKASFRRIRAELAESFTLDFKAAIFDREDDTLLPGAGTCSACPKRTGNSPVFEDVAQDGIGRWEHTLGRGGEPNRCTDPDCWAAKTKAHLARGAAQLQAEGKVVITGSKARAAIDAHGTLKPDYVPLDKARTALKKAKAAAAEITVQHVQDPRTGKVVKAVLHADLVKAGVADPQPAAAAKHQAERYDSERWARQRAEEEARCTAETQRRVALLQRVRGEVRARERDEFDLRLAAAAALAGVEWHERELLARLYDLQRVDALFDLPQQLGLADLNQLIMDCAIVRAVPVASAHAIQHSKPEPLLALAQHYGIDAQAVMQQASAQAAGAASTPPSAGAGATQAGQRKAPAGVAYWCAETGASWSGRGLQPAWLKAQLAAGKSLSDYAVAKKVKVGAGSAGGRAKTPAQADTAEAAA